MRARAGSNGARPHARLSTAIRHVHAAQIIICMYTTCVCVCVLFMGTRLYCRLNVYDPYRVNNARVKWDDQQKVIHFSVRGGTNTSPTNPRSRAEGTRTPLMAHKQKFEHVRPECMRHMIFYKYFICCERVTAVWVYMRAHVSMRAQHCAQPYNARLYI